MSGFKKSQPGLSFAGEKITPDEIDKYEVYTVVNPGTTKSWWGTAPVSGTADTQAFVVVNAMAGYPRNMTFTIAGNGTSVAVKGTALVNGKDQFGSVISETLAITSGTASATAIGTKVFAVFTSGTCKYGTFSTSGTPSLGFDATTACLFGLPVKLGAATDVVLIGQNAGTGAITVGGGTIAAYVNKNMSAISPASTITGTEAVTAWIKSTYDATNMASEAGLKAVV
jgi:hypothetical protein